MTIQKILNDADLGTRYDRWLALEEQNAEKAIELTAEQAAFLEKMNPCFRERHVKSGAPGELLSADTFFVGTLKGVGKVWPRTRWSTPMGAIAFGFLHVSKQPEAAVAVLLGRRAALLLQARPAGGCRAHRQWPGVLRNREAAL